MTNLRGGAECTMLRRLGMKRDIGAYVGLKLDALKKPNLSLSKCAGGGDLEKYWNVFRI